jgi:hypothetical protein
MAKFIELELKCTDGFIKACVNSDEIRTIEPILSGHPMYSICGTGIIFWDGNSMGAKETYEEVKKLLGVNCLEDK